MTARGRWVVETRAKGSKAWSRWLDAGTREAEVHPSKAAATRAIRAARAVMPSLEYRAREAGGARGDDAGRSTVEVKLRLAPESCTALAALAARRGLDRSATVAALVREARGRG